MTEHTEQAGAAEPEPTGRRDHLPVLAGIEPDEEQAKRIRRSVFATRLFLVALVVLLLGWCAALLWMVVRMALEQDAAAHARYAQPCDERPEKEAT